MHSLSCIHCVVQICRRTFRRLHKWRMFYINVDENTAEIAAFYFLMLYNIRIIWQPCVHFTNYLLNLFGATRLLNVFTFAVLKVFIFLNVMRLIKHLVTRVYLTYRHSVQSKQRSILEQKVEPRTI